MTRDELREKYKDAPNRADMTMEEERELVADLFDAYEQEGFAPVFWSQGADNSQYYAQYRGKPFTVVRRLPEYDPRHPDQYAADLECLPMWQVRFEDGFELSVYPDEIIPSVMRGCGCPEEYLKKD